MLFISTLLILLDLNCDIVSTSLRVVCLADPTRDSNPGKPLLEIRNLISRLEEYTLVALYVLGAVEVSYLGIGSTVLDYNLIAEKGADINNRSYCLDKLK